MTDIKAHTLARTVLHAWHAGHGARMVPFGGWEMPVQYTLGITREHIATRTAAGLFDVSHMGRFRIAGALAERFLACALTNDPATLLPGEAQYTLLANAQGGAIDDAYLYRLEADDFLLVVNASNRMKDWNALHALTRATGVTLEEVSEPLAMIALQGPRAGAMISRVMGELALPEPRRNRTRIAAWESHRVIVSRTGYTGEAVCFELFVPREAVVALWQRLVDAGAEPAGLGARDSLRLEAGLPLYGHELGPDVEGNDIPIFANALARFGVRASGRGSYVGVAALEQQRAEYEAIVQGRCATPPAQRLLKRIVKAIAAFDSRRPLRAGHRLLLGGEPVGYVTSGTSVPVARAGARLDDLPQMRPIGLALVRSDLQYDPDRAVQFAVHDARGEVMTATLVARNLPPPQR